MLVSGGALIIAGILGEDPLYCFIFGGLLVVFGIPFLIYQGRNLVAKTKERHKNTCEIFEP